MSFSFNFHGNTPGVSPTENDSNPVHISKKVIPPRVYMIKNHFEFTSRSLQDTLPEKLVLLSGKNNSGEIVDLFCSKVMTQHNRLVEKQIYEGGGSFWESTVDLLAYLNNNIHLFGNLQRLVEIGCGQGFAGIYGAALLKNIKSITFQDLNQEVLDTSTTSNILLNKEALLHVREIQFIAGRWEETASFFKSISKNPSLILASEVLYHKDQYPHLSEIVETLLKPKNSVLLIATKRYYFGLGGGTESFKNYLQERHQEIKVEVVHTVEDGKSMTRDILCCCKQSPS